MTQTTSGATPVDLLARPPYRSELLDRLHDEWGPLFRDIASGTVQRELDGVLPFEAVRRLKDEGFGALRVPRAYGGRGATVAGADGALDRARRRRREPDAGLPGALRVRRGPPVAAPTRARPVGVVRTFRRRGDRRQRLDGGRAGRRSTPRETVLDPQVDGYRLSGTKYYTTGSIFAEWADVYARRHRHGQDDDFAIAVVDTRVGGVTVSDDWDGFGQRGTGSGTTTFERRARCPPDHVLPFDQRFPYQTAVYQLNLLATLSGIARAALADAVDEVRSRERNFSHANAAAGARRPAGAGRVGEIAAATYAAEAATLRVAAAVQDVSITAQKGDAAIAGRERGGRDRVGDGAGGRERAGAPRDHRPVRHPGCLGHVAGQGARPALAQRPDGGVAQPAAVQGARGRRHLVNGTARRRTSGRSARPGARRRPERAAARTGDRFRHPPDRSNRASGSAIRLERRLKVDQSD